MRFVAAFLLVASCAQSPEGLTPFSFGVAADGEWRSTRPVDTVPAERTTTEPPFKVPQPPISGGTLLRLRNGLFVAGDPDLDMLWLFEIKSLSEIDLRTIALPLGVEVGRMAEDSAGWVHVLLRRTGEVASFDSTQPQPAVSRKFVCGEPRSIIYRESNDVLLVACGTGELVSLRPDGSRMTVLQLGRDLSDVALAADRIIVSTSRTAELLRISDDDTVIVQRLPTVTFTADGGSKEMAPGIIWRTVATASGDIFVAHQLAATAPIELRPDAGFEEGDSVYGDNRHVGCIPPGIITNVVTRVQPNGDISLQPIRGALPVDLVVGSQALFVASFTAKMVTRVEFADFVSTSAQCDPPLEFGRHQNQLGRAPLGIAVWDGGWAGLMRAPTEVIAGRDPNQLTTSFQFQLQGAPFRAYDDHELFYRETPSGLACVSCHPDGREDGRTWTVNPGGRRRTQTLAGGLSATAPFHWDGMMSSFDELLREELTRRMGGDRVTPAASERLLTWLNGLRYPAPRGPRDQDAAAGRVLFPARCATCHAGPLLTNNASVDVGTGGTFQVPSLIGVGARPPFMHDGCAATLEDVFTARCGGSAHRALEGTPDVGPLVAYLKTL